ncbi:N-acetyltransferase [Salinibacterium sp. SWN248]|uniref:GNAT family N-acetyltransferase n=1 Tax=Salinibacterium sp. SWN248 TaxID=2792056 RepID=UPI0018CC8CF1|nr:GNAT family N-acetyltransferase [Salinibacterium sp. SWN248]MBH0023024.1 GNAT family N-acetyltransferase [Salinibacterium sp. SWN248]
MTTVNVRPMTTSEFDAWQHATTEEFAAEQVAIGRWPLEGSIERAVADNASLLPQGSPDLAYLFDIQVVEERRGSGLGRALLAAVEAAVLDAGVPALELNVFGHNTPAVSLYGSSGYTVTTQQMRKTLSPNP